jgi:transcriptional regulator with XRE-family HTH domain
MRLADTKTKVIADRCRTARVRAGLLQKQLAEILGVTMGLISQWESGRIKKINPKHIEVLAKLAEVSVDWLSAKDITDTGGPVQWMSVSLNEIPKEFIQNQDFIKGVLWAEDKLKEKNT